MAVLLMTGDCDTAVWQRSVAAYRAAHPAATVQDIYKFVYHGIMGSEHAVRDTAAVRGRLVRELHQLSTGERRGEGWTAEVESLPPDGRLVRVHLRPFLDRGGDTESLLRAFIATANSASGDTAQFACAQGALAAVEGFPGYVDARRTEGFPAVHHSKEYEARYQPAYRVIDRRLVP